jgi:hypothetical protein
MSMIRVFKDNPINPTTNKIYERYVKLTGFKDDIDQDIIFKKIELLLKEYNSKRTVFG